MAAATLAIDEALANAAAHAARVINAPGSPWKPTLALSGALAPSGRCLDRLGRDLTRIIRDARADFYVGSHAIHKPDLDADIDTLGAIPSPGGMQAAKMAAIHGTDLATEVESEITTAKLRLQAAVSAAMTMPEGERRLRTLDGWKAAMKDTLEMSVTTWLSDSSRALHDAVGFP
jgi:hypothetical protein